MKLKFGNKNVEMINYNPGQEKKKFQNLDFKIQTHLKKIKCNNGKGGYYDLMKNIYQYIYNRNDQ